MLHKFSDRIRYSDPVVETDRPSLGYVDGGTHRLMVDAGCSASHVRDFYALLEAEGLAAPDMIVVTHSHWDHSYGLSAVDALSFSSIETYENLKKDQMLRWSREDLAQYRSDGRVPKFCADHMVMEYDDPASIQVTLPQIVFRGQLRINLGEYDAVFYQPVNPHSPDSIIVYIPQEKVLFSGDAIYEMLFDDHWEDQPDLVAELMQELQPIPFKHCIVAHSSPTERPVITKEELFAWFAKRIRG